MKSHPQNELLQAFLTDLRTDEAGLVLHLVRCPTCQVEVEAVLAPADQQGWTFSPHPRSEVDYESVWRRVASRQGELMERLRQERAMAAPLLGELLALPHRERLARIAAASEDCRSLTLAHELLEEARFRTGPERGEIAQAVTAILDLWGGLVGDLTEDAQAVDLGTGAWSEVGRRRARPAGSTRPRRLSRRRCASSPKRPIRSSGPAICAPWRACAATSGGWTKRRDCWAGRRGCMKRWATAGSTPRCCWSGPRSRSTAARR